MVLVTMLRGFKVPLDVLDAFLTANGVPDEHQFLCAGLPPSSYDGSDKATTLLCQRAQNEKIRVFIPQKERFNNAHYGYVAFDWLWVFAQRRITPDELASTYSPTFEELRKDILSHGKPGMADDDEFQKDVFVIVTDEQVFTPPEITSRYENIRCDQCDATFPDGHYYDRQRHRSEVHGSREGWNELPDSV